MSGARKGYSISPDPYVHPSRLRALRWLAGMTQAQLAARMGVNQRSVAGYEMSIPTMGAWRVYRAVDWLTAMVAPAGPVASKLNATGAP